MLPLDEPFKGLFTQGMVVHETYSRGEGAQREWIDAGGNPHRRGRRTPPRQFCSRPAKTSPSASIEKMSKSKKNVVDPDDIIASYGADTARFFVLSDSPPDRDVHLDQRPASKAPHRFVQRVWRLIERERPRNASDNRGRAGP